jgi:hypothetical protein
MRLLVRIGEVAVFLPTFVIKIAGLVLGIDEVLIRNNTKPLIVLLAAFMMAGGQVSQGAVTAFMDRLFGPSITHERKPPEEDPL